VVRLSRRSTAAAACGEFAAECPAGRTYRSSNGAAARRSAANAGSVNVDSRVDENTDFFIMDNSVNRNLFCSLEKK